MIVGKGGIKICAVAAHAATHGALKRGLRPGADPALRVWRDVGGIDCAERRRQRAAAGKFAPARCGVTYIAIADGGERGAPLHQIGREAVGRWRHDRSMLGACAAKKKVPIPSASTRQT